MQGYILTTGSARNLILGDDGGRYKFESLEWQSDDVEPTAGMRVDFEASESNATDIYPVLDASPVETMGGASPARPPAGLSANERFKARLSRMHDQLNVRYSPIREIVGDYGVIAAGIAMLAVGSIVRFDFLETLVDLVAAVGIIAGAAIAGVGIFMLGKEEGWWGKDDEQPSGQAGSAPAAPGGVSSIPAESYGTEGQASEDTELAGAMEASRRMKTCPHCAREILYAAIKCRYCGSDVPSEADSP